MIKSAPLIVEYNPRENAKSDVLIAHGDSIPVPYDIKIEDYFAVDDNGTGVEVLLRVLNKLRNASAYSGQSKGIYWAMLEFFLCWSIQIPIYNLQ